MAVEATEEGAVKVEIGYLKISKMKHKPDKLMRVKAKAAFPILPDSKALFRN